MKFRSWMNVLIFILLCLAIFFGRHQIVQAWGLLGKVDLRIFLFIIPLQFFSYYAVGEVMFSYLRSKGNLKTMSRWRMTRIALELNFVNHIIPVPSIAGFSYLGWVLNRYDVSAGRATMAQMIRYVMMFVSFIILIVISIVALLFDQKLVDRTVVIISLAFILAAIVCTAVLIYFVGNRKRLVILSNWFTKIVNNVTSKITRGKKRHILNQHKVEVFFIELHEDYLEIRKDKKILIRPLLWAITGNLLDVSMIYVAFLSLGYFANPATLIIAYGVSSFAAIFAATPGGSGVYEAIMIAFLVSAGVPAGVAIAGTLLARVTLFAGTIIFGYLFYQLTINKYGKVKNSSDI